MLWSSEQFFGQPQQQRRQQASSATPPASRAVIQSLKQAAVTAEDLIEETNQNCCICLDDHELGSMATKLPCGHLFHLECITDWLSKNCSCPICRFELPTDNAQYERERRERMSKRKRRYRLRELQHKSVAELRVIMRELSVSTAGCIEKQELIDRLVESGKIDLAQGLAELEISMEELQSKSVKELRQLLLSYGLSAEGAVEKRELIEVIARSEYVRIVASRKSEGQGQEQVYERRVEAEIEMHQEEAGESKGEELSSSQPSSATAYAYSPARGEHLYTWSVSELKSLMRALNIPTTNCVEKADMVNAILAVSR